jgi:hypothetical protein
MARALKFKRTAPIVPEKALHRQIADALRVELAPAGQASPLGVMWYATDAANFGGVAGARWGRGVVAGVPDLTIIWHGIVYFIEIKTEIGRLSAAQQRFHEALRVAGAPHDVARSVHDVLALIDRYRIPRAHRIRGA